MSNYKRLLTDLNDTFFLFGMRGTGKTSWARAHFSDAFWFNLIEVLAFNAFVTKWASGDI